MGLKLGMSFGNDNIYVARLLENGEAEIIYNQKAAIYIDDDVIAIGDEAYRTLNKTDNYPNFVSFLRIDFEHTITTSDKTYSQEDIITLIIKKVIDDIKEKYKEEVDSLTFASKTYETHYDLSKIANCIYKAGIKEGQLFFKTYPCAIADYLKQKGIINNEQNLLIFDLGLKTCGFTLVDNQSKIIGYREDCMMGTADLCSSLYELMVSKVCEESFMCYEEFTNDDEKLIRSLVNEVLFTLSKKDNATINLKINEQDITINISREEFEMATEHFTSRVMEMMDEAMNSGHEIDMVCLIGGGSNIPRFVKAMKAKYNISTYMEEHPEYTTAFAVAK